MKASHRLSAVGLVSLLFLMPGGCASPGAPSEGGTASRSRNLISRVELEGMDELTVYQAVRRLRPTWLRYRGQATITGANRESLRVYLNRQYFGNAESLSNIRVRDVQEIRFLDAREATLRFGTDHTVGAIVISTGRG